MNERNVGRMKKRLMIAAAAFMAAALLFSGFQIWRYFAAENEAEDAYGALADLIEAPPTLPSSAPGKPSEAPPTVPGEWTVQDQYGALFAQNPDMVGWISIDDTAFNYPVMQTPRRPDYYLMRGFDGQRSDFGVPYAAERCSINPASDNITIYGHHMKSGKLFGALDGYTDKAFWRQHPVIRFDTRAGFGQYAVLAVFKTTPAAFPYHEFMDAADEAEFDAYVRWCVELSLYCTGVTAKHGDKLITLSTCEYTQADGRLVVVGVRI